MKLEGFLRGDGVVFDLGYMSLKLDVLEFDGFIRKLKDVVLLWMFQKQLVIFGDEKRWYLFWWLEK